MWLELLDSSFADLCGIFRQYDAEAEMTKLKDELSMLCLMDDQFPVPYCRALAWADLELHGNGLFDARQNFRAGLELMGFKKNRHYTGKKISETYRRTETGREADLRYEIYFSIQGLYYFVAGYSWESTQVSPRACAVRMYISDLLHKYHEFLVQESRELRHIIINSENKKAGELVRKIRMGNINIKTYLFGLNGQNSRAELIGGIYFICEEDNANMFKIGYTGGVIDDKLCEFQAGNPRRLRLYRFIMCPDPSLIDKVLRNSGEAINRETEAGNWLAISPDRVDKMIYILRRTEGCVVLR